MQIHRHHADIPAPGPSSRRSRPSPRLAHTVMWAAIGLAFGLFGLLLILGWANNAATTAGATLLLACVAVCIWAGVQGRSTDREIDRAIARLAATREQGQRCEPGH